MTRRATEPFDSRDRHYKRLEPCIVDGRWAKVERDLGRITYLAHGKGYVMVRRPGAGPFAIQEKVWLALAVWAP